MGKDKAQLFGIDGEDWTFKKSIIIKTCPGKIEYLFDAIHYFNQHKVFN